MDEFSLIDHFFARPAKNALLGIGDDAALLSPAPGMALAATADMLVEGRHFFPDAEASALGWKTLAVNVSDLAAMGAKPRWALLCLGLPKVDEAWLSAFCEGFFACAEAYGVELVGGDTTASPFKLFSVAAHGEVPAGQALRRDGAKPGDEVWVSGTPGLAALGLRQLQGQAGLPAGLREKALERLARPVPRVELGLGLRGLAHAAIDVSDGLAADLGHIAERSGVDAVLSLPAIASAFAGIALDAALAGGDDYELCFTAKATRHAEILGLQQALSLPLACIGRIEAAKESGRGTVRDESGAPLAGRFPGFDHFSAG